MQTYRSEAEVAEHKRASMLHAITRAQERMNMTLTEHDILGHLMLIWAGKSTKLGNGAIRRELHMVVDGSRIFLAVFDPKIRRIVTYLSIVTEWKGGLTPAGERLRNTEATRLPTTERDHDRHSHATAC